MSTIITIQNGPQAKGAETPENCVNTNTVGLPLARQLSLVCYIPADECVADESGKEYPNPTWDSLYARAIGGDRKPDAACSDMPDKATVLRMFLASHGIHAEAEDIDPQNPELPQHAICELVGKIAMRKLAATVAEAHFYSGSWSDEFTLKHVREAYGWASSLAKRHIRWDRLDGKCLDLLGFGTWTSDKAVDRDIAELKGMGLHPSELKERTEALERQRNLRLVPLWLFGAVPDDLVLTCISGEELPASEARQDADHRGGMTAYGLHPCTRMSTPSGQTPSEA